MARDRECNDCDALVGSRCEAIVVCPHQEPEDVGMDLSSVAIAFGWMSLILLVMFAAIFGVAIWRG